MEYSDRCKRSSRKRRAAWDHTTRYAKSLCQASPHTRPCESIHLVPISAKAAWCRRHRFDCLKVSAWISYLVLTPSWRVDRRQLCAPISAGSVSGTVQAFILPAAEIDGDQCEAFMPSLMII